MDDVRTRLTRCFLGVFPDLTPEQAAHASPETVAAWDSVASVTLLTLLEEEFGVSIDVEDLAQFTSFENLQTYLQKRTEAGK